MSELLRADGVGAGKNTPPAGANFTKFTRLKDWKNKGGCGTAFWLPGGRDWGMDDVKEPGVIIAIRGRVGKRCWMTKRCWPLTLRNKQPFALPRVAGMNQKRTYIHGYA